MFTFSLSFWLALFSGDNPPTGATLVSKYHQGGSLLEETETRPLTMALWNSGNKTYYDYTHTLNKDVSELVDANGNIQAAYDYDPFGNIVSQNGPLAGLNFFRHSSEYHDEELGLVYYNYRHYNPRDGRWIGRDPIEESGGLNLYAFLQNQAVIGTDFLGYILHWHHLIPNKITKGSNRNRFPSGFDPNGKGNGWVMDEKDHNRKGGIHSDGWNKDWKDWFDRQPEKITQNALDKQMDDMKEKYQKQLSKGTPTDLSYNEWNAEKYKANKARHNEEKNNPDKKKEKRKSRIKRIEKKSLTACNKMIPYVGWAMVIDSAATDFTDPNMSTEEAVIANTPVIGGFYDAFMIGTEIGEMIW